MAAVYAYLTFNGNCRHAMKFYEKCLGGKLVFNTVGQFMPTKKMSGQMKDCIVNATLTNKALVLIGTDMPADNCLLRGNNVSLMLICNSEQEMLRRYKKLSAGGEKTRMPARTFGDALFGTLTDRYGNHWLLNYQKKE
jgi:PhnB protein